MSVDPSKRFTVDQCLEHPYLQSYHDPEDEPSARPLDPSFFDFDLQKDAISRDDLKKLLYVPKSPSDEPYTVQQVWRDHDFPAGTEFELLCVRSSSGGHGIHLAGRRGFEENLIGRFDSMCSFRTYIIIMCM